MNSPDPSAGESSARLRRRYLVERLFRLAGASAVLLAVAAVATLFVSILTQGLPGFVAHEVELDIDLSPELVGIPPSASQEEISRADYQTPVRQALGDLFPEVESRRDRRALRELISSGSQFVVREAVLEDPSLLGSVQRIAVPLSDEVDLILKGDLRRDLPEEQRALSDAQLAWLDRLEASGRVERIFNTRFFTSGDSREPELAGVGSAMLGSFLTLLITALLCVPIGVAAAVYLEEFSPQNRLTHWIEVNINNLAAVPSIVFGLLGLGILLNIFGLPRSAPLAGGVVLSLMTLPTVILASRAAIKAVPPSIKSGALGVGASPLQAVTHHVLPLALPGIMTGTIIGMAQALGETAPLLMIGMVAFIVDMPTGFTSPATVLPVQIFLWSDSPERAFQQKTAAAILVLIAFLLLMNLLAVVLRRRFERRW